MKILTFVIPAYNSEAFLDKCVSSMLSPEILDKLEIIVVNDGSKDTTAEIAGSYCAQYPGVVRLISQENKGHGGALNTGCAAAQGKYLKVIDADDWVETQNLPEFVRLLEQCDSDVVLTHYRTVHIGTGEEKDLPVCPEAYGQPCGFGWILSDWRAFEHGLTFHGITYRTEFYQNSAAHLPEHVFYEDHTYATFPCSSAGSVVCFDLFIYEYRIGDVNQSVSDANQLRRLGHMETVLRDMMRRYRLLPQTEGRAYAVKKTLGLLMRYFIITLLVNPNRKEGREQAGAMLAYCRQEAPEVYGQVKWKYGVFLAMNRVHMEKEVWDRVLESKLYRKIQKKPHS